MPSSLSDQIALRIRNYIEPGYYKDVNVHSNLIIPCENLVSISLSTIFDHTNGSLKIQDVLNSKKFVQIPIEGYTFGPSWSFHWFKIDFSFDFIPQSCYLYWFSGCEGLAFSSTGQILCGLSEERKLVSFNPKICSDFIIIQCSCNSMFGNGWVNIINAPDPDRYFCVENCKIVSVNEKAATLINKIRFLLELYETLPVGHPSQTMALIAANNAVNRDDVGPIL